MLVYPTSVRHSNISDYICWNPPSLYNGSFGETILGSTYISVVSESTSAPLWLGISMSIIIEHPTLIRSVSVFNVGTTQPPALKRSVSVFHVGAKHSNKCLHMLGSLFSRKNSFGKRILGFTYIYTNSVN